jgi:hypothetical protein
MRNIGILKLHRIAVSLGARLRGLVDRLTASHVTSAETVVFFERIVP